MNRIIKIILVLALLSGFVFGKSNGFAIGIDPTVLVGMIMKGSPNKVKSVIGVSPGLGIGYKHFLGSGATRNKFNLYWGVGTDTLDPFASFGADYLFKGDLRAYVGAGVTARLSLEQTVWPTLSLGLYL
jgi:hypothetical protein